MRWCTHFGCSPPSYNINWTVRAQACPVRAGMISRRRQAAAAWSRRAPGSGATRFAAPRMHGIARPGPHRPQICRLRESWKPCCVRCATACCAVGFKRGHGAPSHNSALKFHTFTMSRTLQALLLVALAATGLAAEQSLPEWLRHAQAADLVSGRRCERPERALAAQGQECMVFSSRVRDCEGLRALPDPGSCSPWCSSAPAWLASPAGARPSAAIDSPAPPSSLLPPDTWLSCLAGAGRGAPRPQASRQLLRSSQQG